MSHEDDTAAWTSEDWLAALNVVAAQRDTAVADLAAAREERDAAIAAADDAASSRDAWAHDRSTYERERAEAAEAQVDTLLPALAALVAAVEPLMASKPVELMKDGLMRYDWTDALYAIQESIGPARAALAVVAPAEGRWHPGSDFVTPGPWNPGGDGVAPAEGEA